jgi:hypothetical protein
MVHLKRLLLVFVFFTVLLLVACEDETPVVESYEREIPVHEDVDLNQYAKVYFDDEECTLRIELDGESFDETFFCVSVQRDYGEEFHEYYFYNAQDEIIYKVVYSRVIFKWELQTHMVEETF